MTALSWAQAYLCAAHDGPDGRTHGHTYMIRAYWADDGGDILVRRRRLLAVLQDLDHGVLPPDLTRAEDLAEHVAIYVDAHRVDVSREAEGVGAIWVNPL